ncbi:otolith matrix protein OMM-64 isoform X2 [Rhodamnia argentea]|uniref:Otolith matrix protein OMM-64 isoform X2 n=1 Tax=Rhodamnia argentea TaxID=178133 RepID=A0A8B8MMK1_9MYRT|nr:otolith matrix protein OMM-64 isoform X2 [Rhodamnia argentea]
MESADDIELPSPADPTSPPAHVRKLKRLKKAAQVAVDHRPSHLHDSESPNPPSSLVRSLYPESQSSEDSGGLRLEEPRDESSSELELPAPHDPRGEGEFVDSEPALFGVDDQEFGSETDGFRAKRVLEFDSAEERLDAQKGGGDGEAIGEGMEDSRSDLPEKRQSSTEVADGGVEDMKKRKKRKAKGGENCVVEDENQAHATNKRRSEKGRRDSLKQLRADSQRLLRETRDAMFKPAPLVQKPISSILEKIRQRKLELSKKSIMLKNLSTTCSSDEFLGEDLEFELEISHNQKAVEDKAKYVGVERNNAGSGEKGRDVNAPTSRESDDTSNEPDSGVAPSQRTLGEGSNHTFRAPINDTQELFSDSQSSENKDDLPNETPKSPVEEVFAPSLLAMNLKFDSAPQDDMSDEEDNDKENIDPHMHQSVDLSLSPKGDPVKDFIDEEAEEEDDSDNDLHHFQDNEEEDIEDAEELNEMIEADYKEKPIDNERRNQLHQEWLEQQDAAGTENLMQRLNCGLKQRDTLLDLEEDEKDVEGEEDEEFGDDGEDLAPANTARINLRKAKQMIPEVFTDKDDTYVSSDDEEFETQLAKQSLFRKTEAHVPLMSPAEDEGSREVFHRIKKLNMTPDDRKKPKTSSRFDASLARGKTIGILKPSFLGRGANPLASSNNHKTSAVRTYVFGRDDSNSKSIISTSEDSLDMIHKGSRPTRTSVAKFSSSESRCSTQTTETAGVSSTPTLHDILRRSSLHSDPCAQETIVGQTESMFAAFRLGNKSKSRRILM